MPVQNVVTSPWRSGVKSKHSGPSEVIQPQRRVRWRFPSSTSNQAGPELRLAAPGVDMNQDEIVYQSTSTSSIQNHQ